MLLLSLTFILDITIIIIKATKPPLFIKSKKLPDINPTIEYEEIANVA